MDIGDFVKDSYISKYNREGRRIGSYKYQIDCSLCNMAAVGMTKRSCIKATYRLGMRGFAWIISNGKPVCPDCQKRG